MRAPYLAIVLVACGGSHASRPPDPRVSTLDDRIAHALLPTVQVQGEDLTTPLAERMAALHIPGLSVAVFEDYQLVFAHAYGVTEAGGATPVTTSTLFQAGSISKSINALAVLGAVADGKLSLDAPVNDQLRSWHLPDNELTAATPVTIRHLLSHTGGTTVHGFPGYEAGKPIPTLVQVLDGAPPANTAAIVVDLAPGTFRYSGGGTSITQLALIDNLGAPYPALLHDRVLAPLGMTASTYEQPLPEARVAEAASGTYVDGAVVPGKRHVYPEMAAAGLWTTPTDLVAAFAEIALARTGKSKKLTKALADQMTTKVAPAGGPGDVGLGVFLTDHRGTPVFGHGGADEGFQADVVVSLDGGFGVVVMANSDNGFELFPDVERTVWAAMGWPGEDPSIVRVPLEADQRAAFAGDYAAPDGLLVSVVVDGDALRLVRPLGDVIELVPVAPDRVVDRVRGMQLALAADGAMSITPVGGAAVTVPRRDPQTPHPLLELAAGRFDAAVAAWTPGVFEESAANQYAYELIGGGHLDGAVQLLRLIVAVFPDSANAHDSLADGLAHTGDTAGAIAAYEQALALLDADPRIPADQKAAIRAYEQARLESLRGR